MDNRRIVFGFLVGVALLAPVLRAATPPAPIQERDLDRALKTLRGVVPTELKSDEKEAKIDEIVKAWEVITAQGEKGCERIDKELQKIKRSKKRDDFFALSACALFWQIRGLDASEKIAELMNEVDSSVQYNYVFMPAFEAAQTQDPRALPLLKACLDDREGSFFVLPHAMNLRWPQFLDFIWGAYGPAGLPVLRKILESSEDDVEMQAAIRLLTKAHDIDALPAIRGLTDHQSRKVRNRALESLGSFGHPDDYDLIEKALRSKDPNDAKAALRAAGQYQDLRATPLILDLFKSSDSDIRSTAANTIGGLLTLPAFVALHHHAETSDVKMEKKWCDWIVTSTLASLDLDWQSFMAKSEAKKKRLVLDLHKEGWRSKYERRPGDRKFNHEDLLAASREWIENYRITGGSFEWVEERHVLAAATHKDVDLLLRVRAAVFSRLSDECLYEVQTLESLIRWLNRSRYRKDPGVCEKVEAPR